MANLELIKSLNIHYHKESPIAKITNLKNLNEAFNPDKIEKALSNTIADLGPIYTRYFDFGLQADVAMLFIDVCSFSTNFESLNGKEVGEYFDEYYDLIIPIIYKYGGEIDKIIGDGIIAVFGPPFLDREFNQIIKLANQCSKSIIKSTIDTKFASKIALHSGSINYFKNKSGLYDEFTMIGKPLTELFRLESISEDNCINYYDQTKISDFYNEYIQINRDANPTVSYIPWKRSQKLITNLKGVDYKRLYCINYKPLQK